MGSGGLGVAGGGWSSGGGWRIGLMEGDNKFGM